MKPILLIFFLVCSIFINAQDKIPVTKKRIDTIHSYILNEDRYLYVNLPENTNGISELPVIYVLDAEVLFDAVNNTMNRLSKEGSTKKAIILGIGNIWQRYRDYSPTHINSSPFVDAHSASVSGGGEKFISFIEKEVFPYTRSKYSTSSDRILIGHSMGGLIAMNILLKNARMFNYYACIDPSMWWDDRRLLKESKRILADNTFENRTLFLAVANTEQHDMDVPEIKLDSTDKTALIRPSLLLADYLSSNQQNKLRFGWKFFKDHDHMSVPAPAMYDALRFFFN